MDETRNTVHLSGSLSRPAGRALPLAPTRCATPLQTHHADEFRRRGGREGQRGFTLVEMIVAVALFSVVMLVSVGALLSLVGANRKAQALQSVMNNLNIALDGMVRSMRMGNTYHCGSGVFATTQDCSSTTDDPASHYLLAFESYGGDPQNPLDQWVYRFDPDGSVCGARRICKSGDSGAHYVAITAPEVSIDNLQFYVVGTQRQGDTVQPKILVEVKGTAGTPGSRTQTTFSIQATAVQRILDL